MDKGKSYYDFCQECNDYHISPDVCPRENAGPIITTAFNYELPNKTHLWVQATAQEVTQSYCIGLELIFYTLEGDIYEIRYDREIFEDVADKAHQLFYEDEYGYPMIDNQSSSDGG